MSGNDGALEYEAGVGRFARPDRDAAEAAEATEAAGARSLRARFAAWRAERRATKAAREAAAWEWGDRIPPWAFGILHR